MNIDADIAQFTEWLEEASEYEPNDPSATHLATVDATGLPNIRVVLLKNFGPDGFTFYTNLESVKGKELRANPNACLFFYWKTIRKSVEIRGVVEVVDKAATDRYFKSRDRGSRVGAWASAQSRPLKSRVLLIFRFLFFTLKFVCRPVPRPPQWGGFRLVPTSISFKKGRP